MTMPQAFPPDDPLAHLMKQYSNYLRATCRGLCRDAGLWLGEADDFFQRTWMNVGKCPQENWPPAENAKEVKRWLRMIARNLQKDLLRQERRRKGREREYFLRTEKLRSPDSPEPMPGETLKETIEMILERRCTAPMRAIVRHRLAGTGWREIAKELGISLGTAFRLWNAALAILRDRLDGWSEAA
jgi:RNA polymerase sigma factor (sigma-70 family)